MFLLNEDTICTVDFIWVCFKMFDWKSKRMIIAGYGITDCKCY